MKPRKIQKFINNYEKNIKYIREEYYKKISLNQSNETLLFLENTLNIIPYFGVLIIEIALKFSITSLILSILLIILYGSLKELLLNKLQIREKNYYLKEIKKLKFKSIEEYEKNIKEIITGNNGYYSKLLNTLKETHHINEETLTIQSVSGESYYIWMNKKQNMLFLLNCSTNKKPELKRIKTQNIRYYRQDKQTKNILLQTTDELLILTSDSLEVLNNFISNKKYESNNIFTPEEYIKDFELYIHKQKKNIQEKIHLETNKINNNNIIILISLIALIIFYIINKTNPSIIYKLILILITFIIIYNYQNIINIFNYKKITNIDIFKKIKDKTETKDRFLELKKVLNIKENYESIFTTIGERIIVWKNNNYIHLFFNDIKENIKYIVVKSKDIICNQNEDETIILNIKNKKIYLRKDAIETLKNYL